MGKSVEKRFESKIFYSPDGCWYWTGSHCKDGYGLLRISKILLRKAHRVSYEIYKGAIPIDMSVLHRCDNRPCVNPNHLFLGTQVDNLRDMYNKGRGKKTKLKPV